MKRRHYSSYEWFSEPISFSFTLSRSKIGCVGCALLVALVFLIATPIGDQQEASNKSTEDEWLLGGLVANERYRNRAGLRVSSKSKLFQALPPALKQERLDFAKHPYCGEDNGVDPADITIALAAITYKAPLSLQHSLQSWRRNGLLDLVDESMLFINSPTYEDRSLGKEFGMDIYETSERGGNVLAAGGIAYLVGNSSADIILFMEKDFELTASRERTIRELWAAVQHMARGVDVYRLRGHTDFPAEGMPDCCAPTPPGAKPNCPFQSYWKTAGSFADHMNWLRVYCDDSVVANSEGRVVQCANDGRGDAALGVRSLCYSSAESNWSNNPVLFRREWFDRRLRPIALSEECLTDNRLLEFKVMLDWLEWHPAASICSSYQGIFKHVEIDQ